MDEWINELLVRWINREMNKKQMHGFVHLHPNN